MRLRSRLRGLVGCLAAAAAAWVGFAIAATPPVSSNAPSLRTERVVMLMRHGIRPPTKAAVTPPGIAAQPWPSWDVPYGHLTTHGFAAVKLLGAFDREVFAAKGLLPAVGCPAAGDVVVWSDSDERTIRTGDALIEGLAPGCDLPNAHRPEGVTDPLFSPFSLLGDAFDAGSARAAILAQFGSVDAIAQSRRAEFALLERVLGCCAPPACAPGPASDCRLASLRSEFDPAGGRPNFTGPLDFGPTAAQTLMLEYVEGKPMAEVGWGRASRADIEALMRLHAMKGETLQRPRVIARVGAGPLLARMTQALDAPTADDGRRLTVLVGHDTNISDLSGLLGFSWQVDSYPARTPPPGGAFGLALLKDPAGNAFVRAFYRSQTMDQMRSLTPLSLTQPAFQQWLTIDGCGTADAPTSCPLEGFKALVAARQSGAE